LIDDLRTTVFNILLDNTTKMIQDCDLEWTGDWIMRIFILVWCYYLSCLLRYTCAMEPHGSKDISWNHWA